MAGVSSNGLSTAFCERRKRMRRIFGFLREWLERRKRVTDEIRFHLEQAQMRWVDRGLSNRRAHRAAWRDFGKARAQRRALREAGGGVAGLVALFHAHQVSASALATPAFGSQPRGHGDSRESRLSYSFPSTGRPREGRAPDSADGTSSGDLDLYWCTVLTNFD